MTVEEILERERSNGIPVERVGDTAIRDGETVIRTVAYRTVNDAAESGWMHCLRVVVYADDRQLFSSIARTHFEDKS